MTVPPSVTIAPGAVSASFNVMINDATGLVYITATLGSASETVPLDIVGSALAGVTVAPTSVVGGGSTTGTVQLFAARSKAAYRSS